MPLFDYKCQICGNIYKDLESPPEQCKGCLRRELIKLPASPTVIFKGPGWTTKENKTKENT